MAADTRGARLLEHVRTLQSEARAVHREIAEAAHRMQGKPDLSRAVQEHPFTTVLVAAGVGYLLGGGLLTPLTRRALSLGARAVLIPMLKGQLEAMVAGPARSA